MHGRPTLSGYQWPQFGLTPSGKAHFAVMDNATTTHLYYSKVDPWCTWSTPVSGVGSGNDAGFPDYNVVASKQSPKFALLWEYMNANPTTEPMSGWYRETRDDGATWDDPVELPYPNVFTPSSDTEPTFDISSLSGMYDSNDSLHIVGQVTSWLIAEGEGLVIPSVLCHWTAADGWHVIYDANTETLAAPCAQNATYACRATIAQAGPQEYVVVWCQADSLNVEPVTDYLRYDILGSRSTDGGITWGPPVRLATAGTASLHYPCLATTVLNDSCHIRYEADQQAGWAVSATPQGTCTNNPIIHQVFSKFDLPAPNGVAEGGKALPLRVALDNARPNPTRGGTVISYALPRAGNVSLVIHDAAGRPIRTLVNTHASPGSYTASWDGKADKGGSVAAGVYFYTLKTPYGTVSKKLTLLQ